MNTIERIKLYNSWCPIKIMFINQVQNKKWNSWKEVKDCTDEELKEANLRQILDNEIVLDLDEPNKIEDIKLQLNIDNYAYELYATGSRGYHVHLFFKNLSELDIELRKKIRKIIINQYGCDIAKSSEKGILAIEMQPHFKTEKLKVLLEKREGENILNKEIIEKAINLNENEKQLLQNLAFATNDEDAEKFKSFHEKDPFFKYFCKGKLRDWAIIFKEHVETENGEKMKMLFELHDLSSIKKHCEEDVRIIERLYLRCKECNLL